MFVAGALVLASCAPAGETKTATGLGDVPADTEGTVRLLLEDEHDTEVIEALLDGFAEAYPNITLDIEKLAYDSMRDKLVASFQSPDATYDLIMVDNPWMYDFATAGFLQPLDDRIQTTTDYEYDDFFAPLRKVNEVGGATYGVPMYNYGVGYIYRADVFAAAGLEVPQDLDSLVTTVSDLTTSDMAGIAHTPQRGYKIFEEWTSWLLAAGGQPFDADGNPTFDTPEAKVALEAYIETLQDSSPSNSSNWAQDEAIRSLSTGGAASIVGYNWLIASMNASDSGDFAGEFKLAVMPGGRGALGAWSWAIPSNAADSDAAWAFTSWVTSQAVDVQRVATGGALTRQSSATADAVLSGGLGADYYETVAKILASAVPFAEGPNAEQVVQEVGTQLNEAIVGSKTVEQALADAQEAAMRIAGN